MYNCYHLSVASHHVWVRCLTSFLIVW
jgi:hypothetical protein